ncbi:MAG: hypothetical protein ACK559_00455, partial [bacterium]
GLDAEGHHEEIGEVFGVVEVDRRAVEHREVVGELQLQPRRVQQVHREGREARRQRERRRRPLRAHGGDHEGGVGRGRQPALNGRVGLRERDAAGGDRVGRQVRVLRLEVIGVDPLHLGLEDADQEA